MHIDRRKAAVISAVLLLVGALTLAGAQTKVPDIIDLFSPAAMPDDARSTPIPGMSPETVGAVSFFSLSSAGTRSLRAAGASGAKQRWRITLPDNASLVCAFTPERRQSGVVVMRGTVEGPNQSGRCNLYEENGQITGDIQVGAGRFTIVPIGSGATHAIVELKTQGFPNERQMGRE